MGKNTEKIKGLKSGRTPLDYIIIVQKSTANFFKKLLHTYTINLRERNPIKTKIITALVLSSIGDITSQSIEHATHLWNHMRTMKWAFTAGFIHNPMTQLYYNKIAHNIDIRKLIPSAKAKIFNSMFKSIVHFLLLSPVGFSN